MTRSRRITNSTLVRGHRDRGAGSGRIPGALPPAKRTRSCMNFGRGATEAFSNPNGIAIDESTGDVYVADIGTDTVYKFDANGNPVDFSALTATGSRARARPRAPSPSR